MQKHFYPALGYLILAIVLLVPGVHKMLGDIPPNWFVGKFESSIIGSIPFGVELSYVIIMFIEICGGIILLASSIRSCMKKPSNHWVHWGIFSAYLLFTILTFGNFLVQDYDGAFQDFVYFIGIVVIDRHLLNCD